MALTKLSSTVVTLTPADIGLGSVTNESKAAMFTDPTFTGTVSGVTATHVGLGNVTNESKSTMFTDPTFTGTVSGVTATHVGLGNVTNESKTTMFTNPAFTGTPTGITATHVGLGNVTNESKATMFTNPAFTGTPTGITATHVGLGNVTNESKATMFTSPSFTSPSISSGSLTFADSTTQSTANRWVLISTGSETSSGGANAVALTDGTITYGQYSKIQITASFTMTAAVMSIGQNWGTALYMLDGANSSMSFIYNTWSGGSGTVSANNYAPNTYQLIYFAGGSMGRTSGVGPTLRFTWTIECPGTSGWIGFNTTSSAYSSGASIMTQASCTGFYVPGSVFSSNSVYKPYFQIPDPQGRVNGWWEVYGMKK